MSRGYQWMLSPTQSAFVLHWRCHKRTLPMRIGMNEKGIDALLIPRLIAEVDAKIRGGIGLLHLRLYHIVIRVGAVWCGRQKSPDEVGRDGIGIADRRAHN